MDCYLTQMLELAGKAIKIVIITISFILKELRRDMEDAKKKSDF